MGFVEPAQPNKIFLTHNGWSNFVDLAEALKLLRHNKILWPNVKHAFERA